MSGVALDLFLPISLYSKIHLFDIVRLRNKTIKSLSETYSFTYASLDISQKPFSKHPAASLTNPRNSSSVSPTP